MKGKRIDTGDGTALVFFDCEDCVDKNPELWIALGDSLPDLESSLLDMARANEAFICASSVEHVDALIEALKKARELFPKEEASG